MSDYLTHPSVLMLGPSLASHGGMATVEKQLVERLLGEGIHVEFLSTYEDAGIVRKAYVALKALFQFWRGLQTFDILHVHMASRASYERKAIFIRHALRKGKQVIIHHHGGEFGLWFDEELSEAKRNEVRSLFSKVDAVIVLSEEWLDWFDSKDFCTKSFFVMHNAVQIPSKKCSPFSQQDVLFLGRLDENKSPDVLLRASKKMLSEHPDSKLIFAGDGQIVRYESLAKKLNIENRCEFLGWIGKEDKESLFERVGVYCLPSKNEGMPMSVLEAMAHGIPVISTPVGGVPQIIRDGENGYLMPIDNVDCLSGLLCQLMSSNNLRANIGAAGRMTVMERFNIDRNIEDLVHLYMELTK